MGVPGVPGVNGALKPPCEGVCGLGVVPKPWR